MSAKLNGEWFWADRWNGSTAVLMNIEQRGLYREMLTQSWLRDGKLPLDLEMVRRAARCTPDEWERCWPAVKQYWDMAEDFMFNKTQMKIIEESKRRSGAKREAGRRGYRSVKRGKTGKFTASGGGNQPPVAVKTDRHRRQHIDGQTDGQSTASLDLSLDQDQDLSPSPSPSPDADEEKISVRKTSPHPDKSGRAAAIQRIFDEWVDIMGKNPNQAKLTPKRKRLVGDRLKDGYSEAQIVQAIRGCLQSPHHMGQNELGKIYNGLELICRDGEHVEQFLDQQSGLGIGLKMDNSDRLAAYAMRLRNQEEKDGVQG